MNILATTFCHDINNHDLKLLVDNLHEYTAQFIGGRAKFFSIILKDNDQIVKGGITLFIRPQAIYINQLWVDEVYRKQGYGTKLLAMAEQEGVNHGCQFAIVDTMEFEAEKFYKKNGYQSIGRIENYIQEYDRIFLRKVLIE